MLGWGHSKKPQRDRETGDADVREGEPQAGSAAVHRLLIMLQDVAAADEVPAGQ